MSSNPDREGTEAQDATTSAASRNSSAAPRQDPALAEAPGAGRHGSAEAVPPPKRRLSLSGMLLFLVVAHVLVGAGAAGVVAAILPVPVVVFGVAALAGIVAALVSVGRLSRSAVRSIDALE